MCYAVSVGRLPGPSATKRFSFGSMHTRHLFGVRPTDITTKPIRRGVSLRTVQNRRPS